MSGTTQEKLFHTFRVVETTSDLYYALVNEHGENFSVFSSFSDPTGTFSGSGETGCMETVWGFKGADAPLMADRRTWKINPERPYERIDEKAEFFLVVAKLEKAS